MLLVVTLLLPNTYSFFQILMDKYSFFQILMNVPLELTYVITKLHVTTLMDLILVLAMRDMMELGTTVQVFIPL